MDKDIIYEWISRHSNRGNYTYYEKNDLENVTLDGGFNLKELADKIWEDGWNSGNLASQG